MSAEKNAGQHRDRIEISLKTQDLLSELGEGLDKLVRGDYLGEIVLFEREFASKQPDNGRYLVQLAKGETIDFDLLDMHVKRHFAHRGEIQFQKPLSDRYAVIEGFTKAARDHRRQSLPVVLKPYNFRQKNGFPLIGESRFFLTPNEAQSKPLVLQWVSRIDISRWSSVQD